MAAGGHTRRHATASVGIIQPTDLYVRWINHLGDPSLLKMTDELLLLPAAALLLLLLLLP